MAKIKRECWAQKIGGCSDKASREHVVSKSILDLIGHFNLEVEHDGKITYKKQIGVNSATIKFLCRKHNSDLSSYDKEALKLIRSIKGFAENRSIVEGEHRDLNGVRKVRIDGKKIELWLCKTFLNASAYLGAVDDAEPKWSYGSASKVIEYVFLDKPIEKPFGLYAIPGSNLRHLADMKSNEFSFKVIPMTSHFYSKAKPGWHGPYRVPTLFYFSIFGIEFVFYIHMHSFTMENNPNQFEIFSSRVLKGRKHTYRPGAIGINGMGERWVTLSNGEKTPPRIIEFYWA